MTQDYKPCEVTLEFGDGEYLFKLPLKWTAELQTKCGAPYGAIYKRVVATGDFYVTDLYEVVRCGLIGGGAEPLEARRLIEQYCDQWPLEVWWKHASAILQACMHGYDDGEERKKKAAKAKLNSPSRKRTATAQSSG